MRNMVLVLAVAAVLQGEAGVLGPDGMTAVADTMLARLDSPDFPDTWEGVLRGYYAYEEPGPEAIAIAYAAVMHTWDHDDYVYAYSAADIRSRRWREGDQVIRGRGAELHLARSWPGR
ncbi:MAG: hypothetical protein HPY83_10445 [Anaerolineae bacterium]|nr:hypothetical protein [Anaerolineae bacterium]